jgi:deazaflavin-dependent oxidoreductase (nitroreductase family)
MLGSMPSDQAYARFTTTISARMLRTAGRMNVPVYRMTRGRLMGRVGRAPVLLITTRGRRSGKPRTAPVLYLADGDRLIVIGSNAGNERSPAWALNLEADPAAEVQVRGTRRQIRARITEGEEREQLWRRMNDQYAGFDDYRERTARPINVFVLEPR